LKGSTLTSIKEWKGDLSLIQKGEQEKAGGNGLDRKPIGGGKGPAGARGLKGTKISSLRKEGLDWEAEKGEGI